MWVEEDFILKDFQEDRVAGFHNTDGAVTQQAVIWFLTKPINTCATNLRSENISLSNI